MGLGSRGILAVLALGVVVGVALLKIIADSTDPEGSPGKKNPMSVEDSNDNPIDMYYEYVSLLILLVEQVTLSWSATAALICLGGLQGDPTYISPIS
ncbi:hypothetical protein J1605_001595 [Eschrichtius robustus]|uniref:Uncharacterized protein n=1 Tax=Eschrichtius robustus TaxID=9764 RepID=A0AB34I3F8_ESCRO|nr:hypothetical protein J1605_001595 [Eschrichtius robustus]